jgi:hypothetical protein
MKKYKHKKRNSVYSILTIGTFQCSDKNLDNTEVVIYRDIKDLKIWVRPKDEFFDGRFEEIKDNE